MGFRYRRRIKILPGITLNLGKRGISLTIGGKGLSFSLGKRGTHMNVGTPIRGLTYRKRLNKKDRDKPEDETQKLDPPERQD